MGVSFAGASDIVIRGVTVKAARKRSHKKIVALPRR